MADPVTCAKCPHSLICVAGEPFKRNTTYNCNICGAVALSPAKLMLACAWLFEQGELIRPPWPESLFAVSFYWRCATCVLRRAWARGYSTRIVEAENSHPAEAYRVLVTVHAGVGWFAQTSPEGVMFQRALVRNNVLAAHLLRHFKLPLQPRRLREGRRAMEHARGSTD